MSTAVAEVAEKPESVVEEPAATRLAALEAKASPLRSRLSKIDEEIAKLEAEPEPADLQEAIAARRDRTAKKSELDLERGLLVERLDPLEAVIGPLRAEADADARRTANDAFEAEVLAAIEKAQVAASAFLAEAEAVRKLMDDGRRKGLRVGVQLRKRVEEATGIATKASSAMRGGLR